MDTPLELTTSPSDEDARAISKGLLAFNQAAIGDKADEGVGFSIFSRDDAGGVVGGLRAMCSWDTLHIEVVWVSEEVRGQGLGRALVERAEVFAIEKGISLALLETTSWQARPFYERLGYAVMATIPDYPKGHAMHYMTKKLR
jgi:ribosomal protein S18 acetylase RimI-like enzyme